MSVEITEEMVRFFAEWSGDLAPLHTSDDFAKKAGFEKRVVHGAILFSMMSRFVGMHFPGPQSLWLESDVKFHRPCYAPSKITITGKIALVSEATGSVILNITITDGSGAKIATAKSYHKILE